MSKSFEVKQYSWDDIIYKISLILFLVGFSTIGFGVYLFGLEFPTNISTLVIYLIFILQLVSNSLRFSKILLVIWGYIFIQTFVWNWNYINFSSSLNHFFGLVIFSLVCFSFFSVYIHKISDIVKVYYYFCFIIVCISIFQLFLFVIFNFSFLPQNILSGSLVFQGSDSFKAEILDILPRAVGISTEPAHYVTLLLPAVYISIHSLLGLHHLYNQKNITIAYVILFGYIISFSLIGYFGIGICLFIIYRKSVKIKSLKNIALILGFILLLYFILQTSIGDKVYSFISVSNDITGTKFTSSDQSSFALFSNLLVASESLMSSNFIGTGLNTHKISYDSLIFSFFSEGQIIAELNKDNAGSMFIRILSEFGLPGLFAFLWFLYYCYVYDKVNISTNSAINNMCLVFLILYSTRNGNYLNILFFFFLAMFYHTYKVSLNKSNKPEFEHG